jgi:hypothetical protein
MTTDKRRKRQLQEQTTQWQELASLKAKYRYAALLHQRSGELEIDDDAEVSLGADGQGARWRAAGGCCSAGTNQRGHKPAGDILIQS